MAFGLGCRFSRRLGLALGFGRRHGRRLGLALGFGLRFRRGFPFSLGLGRGLPFGLDFGRDFSFELGFCRSFSFGLGFCRGLTLAFALGLLGRFLDQHLGRRWRPGLFGRALLLGRRRRRRRSRSRCQRYGPGLGGTRRLGLGCWCRALGRQAGQALLRLLVPGLGRPEIPAQGLGLGALDADAVLVEQPEIVLRDGVALFGGAPEPACRQLDILGHTLAAQIHVGEVGLGPAQSLLGGPAVPLGGLLEILGHAQTAAKHVADVALGRRITLAGQRQPGFEGFLVFAPFVGLDANGEIGTVGGRHQDDQQCRHQQALDHPPGLRLNHLHPRTGIRPRAWSLQGPV